MRLVRAGMVAVLAAGTVTMTGGAAEAKPHPAAAWDFNGDGFKDWWSASRPTGSPPGAIPP